MKASGSTYTGQFSRTFRQEVHVLADDGSLKKAEVYTCINVREDSFLLRSFADGTLNVVEHVTGRPSPVPVSIVFHDPGRLLLLYVPPELHARFFDEVRAFVDHLEKDGDIPPHVRNFRTALTPEEVMSLLSEASGDVPDLPVVRPRPEVTGNTPMAQVFAESEAAVRALEGISDDEVEGVGGLPDLNDILDDLPDLPPPDSESDRSADTDVTPSPEPGSDVPDVPDVAQAPSSNRVWLSSDRVSAAVILDSVPAAVMASSPLTPFIQLLRVDSFPLVVLGVISEEGEHVAWPLDVTSREHASVLRTLAKEFVFDLYVYGPDRVLVGERTVKGLLKENVQLILSAVDLQLRVAQPADDGYEKAVSMWLDSESLRELPSVRESEFIVEHPENPDSVHAALERMTPWLEQNREEDLILRASFPVSKWRALVGELMEMAFDMGLPMPEPMMRLAIEHGLAADRRELLGYLIRHFEVTAASGRMSRDLQEDIRRQFAYLTAEEGISYSFLHTPVPQEKEEQQSSEGTMEINMDEVEVIEEEAGDETADGEPAVISSRDWDALFEEREEITSPRAIPVDVLISMCKDREPRGLEVVVKAIEDRPRSDVVRLMPALTLYGRDAVEPLMRLLESPKAFVRQTAALALGELKAEASLDALINAMLLESNWEEFARAVARFGPDLYLEVSSRLKDIEETKEERISYLFALVAVISNDDTALRTLSQSKDERVARTALKALEIRDEVAREHEEIVGLIPLTEETPARIISQNFYMNLIELK